MWLDRWGATAAEIDAPLPGDELAIGDDVVVATRAIGLGAPADEVFGWLAQMGLGRAGWYSYDLIDNLGRRSATELRPDWQVGAVGDQMPGGPISFTVTHVDRPDHLVIGLTGSQGGGSRGERPPVRRGFGHELDFVLAYQLTPLDDRSTRLVSRVHIRIDGPVGRPLAWMLGVGDGVMVRRQLLGLKKRCGPIA